MYKMILMLAAIIMLVFSAGLMGARADQILYSCLRGRLEILIEHAP